MLAIHACWIINCSGMAKRAVRPQDLIKPEREDGKLQTSEEMQGFIEDALDFHKRKFWMKIPNKYAKK